MRGGFARPDAFSVALVLSDGELAHPPVLLTDLSSWREGETFLTNGSRVAQHFRILTILPITDEDDDEVDADGDQQHDQPEPRRPH
jgi:hypothetical protein